MKIFQLKHFDQKETNLVVHKTDMIKKAKEIE